MSRGLNSSYHCQIRMSVHCYSKFLPIVVLVSSICSDNTYQRHVTSLFLRKTNIKIKKIILFSVRNMGVKMEQSCH